MKALCAVGSALLLFVGVRVAPAQTSVLEETVFHSNDPLAQYDDWGKLHQSKTLYPPDTAPRYPFRWLYYIQSGPELCRRPAYVGALQVALQRNGYYCGDIDGFFSPDVSDAIAKLQKNHSMRVTGTLTVPVRRALHLP
jgi:hypothetical protein